MHSFDKYRGAKSRIVRPKFSSVRARDLCAMDASSPSDFGAMSCSNRHTRSDFCSGRLSSVLANDISRISRPQADFATPLSAKFLRRPSADHVNGLADFVGDM